MSVWFCIPSARPPAEVKPVLAAWRKMGYKIALWRDEPDAGHILAAAGVQAEIVMHDPPIPYPGYAIAVNRLAAEVLRCDPACDWLVCGGDDTFPDPNKMADEIARECTSHFALNGYIGTEGTPSYHRPDRWTFGVMQPTGDRFAHGSIDRIAGSPWLGREWCLRANQGNGPLWPEYTHCFADEELQNVATMLGVFWQRPDLTHFHKHFMRASDDINSGTVARPIPVHLTAAFSSEHWERYQALFQRRKAVGFPGHEPLYVSCVK